MFVDEDEGKTMKMMRTKTRMRIRMRMMMMMMMVVMMVVMMMMVMLLLVVVMSHHQHIPINACEEHDRIFARFPTEREPREMCTRMAIQNQPCWATRQISIFVIERLHFKKKLTESLQRSSNRSKLNLFFSWVRPNPPLHTVSMRVQIKD